MFPNLNRITSLFLHLVVMITGLSRSALLQHFIRQVCQDILFADFEGIPALVANGTTATLNCEYSKGKPPDSPLWWEREGKYIKHCIGKVKSLHEKKK